MRFSSVLSFLVIVVLQLTGDLRLSAAPCPTPVCNETTPFPIKLFFSPALGESPDPSEFAGTFSLNTTYTITLVLACSGDFPSVPTGVLFVTSWGDEQFTPEKVQFTTTTPQGDVEIVWMSADIIGGSDTNCNLYHGDKVIHLIREGAPTPSPTPTPSPSPTETPCPSLCSNVTITPEHFSENNPLSVVISHTGVPGSFGGLSVFMGPPHPVTDLGNDSYLAEDLASDTWYTWTYRVPHPCYGQESCFSLFKTGDGTTTPTLTPTPTPTPPGQGELWILSEVPELFSEHPLLRSGPYSIQLESALCGSRE